ncbi:hypothetical protein DAPPUDRAFT_238523 [Daphnia pulex]|uniref:Uncharacterized protein n=1 Tax=Daphnia pulex TaxID=6669 RepID=E9G6M2_DAPPU|nr:hypothetical protein DAPPUDRAFT_238523 [Daphnia pulex]|eukprot:EFX84967.1 hypothetical protein DAPPUDRAFT_238523 [Daphnia pulex]
MLRVLRKRIKYKSTAQSRGGGGHSSLSVLVIIIDWPLRVVSAIGGGRSTLAIDKKTGTANGKGERLLEIKPKRNLNIRLVITDDDNSAGSQSAALEQRTYGELGGKINTLLARLCAAASALHQGPPANLTDEVWLAGHQV